MTLSGGESPVGRPPYAAPARKNPRGHDQFGHPFPPFLAPGDDRRHRSRWRGDHRHSSIIKFEYEKTHMKVKTNVKAGIIAIL